MATDPAFVASWSDAAARDGLSARRTSCANFKPTVLVGVSGQPGAFTESIVRDMHGGLPAADRARALESEHEDRSGAGRSDALDERRAIMGTGSPFAPVEHDGRTHTIGQGNNAFIFPGVGLGATAVEARWLPDEAFAAAAHALFEFTAASSAPGDPIYPPLVELREVSRDVAIAVGAAARRCRRRAALLARGDRAARHRRDVGAGVPAISGSDA